MFTYPLSHRRRSLARQARIVSPVSWVLQFARGVALAALLGVVAMAVALLTGLTSGVSIVLYPLAAVTGVAYVLIPDGPVRPQLLGATAFGVVGLTAALVTGLGALELSGLIGSIAAMTTFSGGLSWRTGIPMRWFAVIAILVVAANLIPLVLDGGGLVHDESAYALKARHWIEETPETGWSIHRGIAMSGYGYLVLEAGGDEGALRLLGLVSIIGFAAATWVLGDKVGGRWVGPVSAIALVSSPTLLRRSTEYLSDVPSSALLMVCMVVAWKQFGERDRPGYGLLWLLPFAWAAFYIRYQSVLSFALIAVAIGILFWDEVKAGWRPVALTAALGAVGLIPHFLYAASETESPLGIILFTADVAGREFYGQGLVDYFLAMGWPLAAFVGPVATVFFVWWLINRWQSVEERTQCLFLMIPAAAQVLILGVLSHGEERFIFFPLGLTLIGGVTGAFVLLREWQPRTARAVSLGLAILLLGSLAMSVAYVRRAVENRAEATELIEMAADDVRAASNGASCGVMTSYFPQVTFYSGCHTQYFRPHLEPEQQLERLDGEERYLLLVEGGKNQPEGVELAGIVDLTMGEAVRITDGDDFADIYEFTP